MKPVLFIILFLLVAGFGFAQKPQNIYFIKDDGQYVTQRDSADFIRVVDLPDSGSILYNVSEFYKDGTPKLSGKSSKIDPPEFEGFCLTFFKSGKKESLINYKDGVRVGEQINYFPNGRHYTVIKYNENTNREDYFLDNYRIEINNDSLGNPLVINGNGYFRGYDDKFSYIQEEGNIKDGLKEGDWKGEIKKDTFTFTENYKAGILITGTAVYKDGKISNYTKSRKTLPEFKGGEDGFGKFLARNIRYPDSALQKNIHGTVLLSFIVEKDGSISAVKVAKSVEASLDAVALRALKKSPKWVPGTAFGKTVQVNYNVPIRFALPY